MAKEEQIKTFPSPRGDKLCQVRQQRQKSKAEVSFRPLAGISCVYLHRHGSAGQICFRPLAGISCVRPPSRVACPKTSFRPLAGISCVMCLLGICIFTLFPSPRGDKLCLQNCPTGACGIGPGSDRITISHSTATGKWQLEIKIPLIFLREPLQTAMQVAAMETRFAQSADSH